MAEVTFKTDDLDNSLTFEYNGQYYRFHEPLGSDLVKLEKGMKTDEESTDAENLALVLSILGDNGLIEADYLDLPLKLYRVMGAEIMASFRA